MTTKSRAARERWLLTATDDEILEDARRRGEDPEETLRWVKSILLRALREHEAKRRST
ncbi:hypothetical protein LCGC14_1535090 [marine sediment metagenome]|uniref:Uncharacterized protein n=1 Tax=marine sediment metagenome TaxID=412755 RepID=A0A0F9JFL6_9ZZZZ